MPVKPCYNITIGGDILKERVNRLKKTVQKMLFDALKQIS